MTTKTFRTDCHYSMKLAFYRLGDEVGGRLGMKKLSWYCNRKKHQWILQYLERKFRTLIKNHQENQNKGIQSEHAPIWVCWWQGEEDAPTLVQKCIKSIRENAGVHPVNIITKDNYSNFLQIPNYIIEKLEANQLSVANFSDYLRFSLLNRYGGLWLDATIFCSKQIPEGYFEVPIFTCKSKPVKSKYVSQHRWTSFCFGGWKTNTLFDFFQCAFELFWEQENQAIDYLFVDYLIALSIQKFDQVSCCFEELPRNNPCRDDLQAAMNAKIPADQWGDVIQYDTIFYKLSWREQYEMLTEDGQRTVYAKLLEDM